MLILTRRTGEAILLDGGVRIVVLETDGQGVRLGIEAPASIGIVREEVAQRIAEENIRAGEPRDARDLLKSLTQRPPPKIDGSSDSDDGRGDGGSGGDSNGEDDGDAGSGPGTGD